MAGVVPSIPRFTFTNAAGVPLSSGSVTVYQAGTTTLATTYQDKALTILNTNPITLDANGTCVVWLDSSLTYKFLLQDVNGATVPGWPVDNIPGAADIGAAAAAATAAATAAAAGYAAAALVSQNAASTSATSAAGSATASAASSNLATLAAATAGAYPNAAASNVPRGLTQASVGAITAGAGGTNGTFALAWSAGNFSINPTGTFTVAGNVLTAVTITGPGQYIGSAPTVPTPSFAASAGLAGAAVVLTAQFLVPSGQGYWVQSVDGTQLLHYLNSSGVATLDTSVNAIPSINVSTRLDTMVGATYETIGRSSTPVTGISDADNTTVLLKPVSRDGSIKHVRAFLGAGATALHVKVFRPSASTLVQISDTSIAAVAGLNTFDADLGNFTAIPVLAGDVVGWYVTGGRMNFANTGTDVYINAAGNVTSFASIGFNTGVTWAFGYDVLTTYHPSETEYEGINRRSQRLGGNLTQTLGRPAGSTLVTGSAPGSATYVFDQTALEDGQITTVRMFSLGIGTFEIRTFDLNNGVFVGSRPLTLNVVAGLNTFNSANGDFTAMNIKRGQRIGFYGASRLADIVATSDSNGFYNGNGSATTGGSVFANTGMGTTVQFQVSFDITYFKTQAVKFSLITAAAYAALNPVDPETLYAVI